jgi:putative oxidoreductase
MLFARHADPVLLVGRTLLAAIFVASGLMKLVAPTATAAYIASYGVPMPMVAGVAAGVLELVAGLLLVAGVQTRWTAIVLAAFLVPVTAIFHNPFGLSGAEAQLQIVQVLKNLAIMGGLLVVAGAGAGRVSVDARVDSSAARASSAAPAKMAA